MKALTICQPQAHFIVTPWDKLPAGCTLKRCERGVLAAAPSGGLGQ
jgi:hypothetical protein